MKEPPAGMPGDRPIQDISRACLRPFHWSSGGLLLIAAGAIPLSLLWDFSWESTVGVDAVWAPAHTTTYLSIALAGFTALALVSRPDGTGNHWNPAGVRLGRLEAPLGVWVTLWGAVAFLTAMLFDRWWRSAYGLGAGIWHPPQILKAIAFFAVLAGVWLFYSSGQNRAALGSRFGFVVAGGFLLAMITVVTLVSIYPNRQHAAWFYKLACATYPVVLVALATAGTLRFPATVASLIYMGVTGLMVWVLPLFPARPEAAPIYNPLDHMMPPPFPLLLVVPAVALDLLFQQRPWPVHRFHRWAQAGIAGLVFSIIFIATQWGFSEFLLTGLADNRFFAGGGAHWPFFLKIDPLARQVFWETRRDEMNWSSGLITIVLAIVAARLGLWLGEWMKRLKR